MEEAWDGTFASAQIRALVHVFVKYLLSPYQCTPEWAPFCPTILMSKTKYYNTHKRAPGSTEENEPKGLLRAGEHYARRVHLALQEGLCSRRISHGVETIDDPMQVRYLQKAHPHAPQTTPGRAGASEAKRRRPLAA